MLIRADLSQREVVLPADMVYVASPMPGVERIMLDRVGGEVARATSIVRYAPGSRFDPHPHELGEEFLVLSGVFSDASGDFGPLCYVRNPPGSAHAPWSVGGCVIFVKLRQFDLADRTRVVIDPRQADWRSGGAGSGMKLLALHRFGAERVALAALAPGALAGPQILAGGAEILVLDGLFEDEFGRYPTGAWLRLPDGFRHTPFSSQGCLLYVKTGHLDAH